MVDALTLTSATYDVLKRVPLEWWSYDDVLLEVSIATRRSRADIRRTVTRLRKQGLVEQRVRHTLPETVEVRRIEKT